MSSLEQSVKDQFAKVFTSHDWHLFKEMAEINLAEAAMLRKSSFKAVPPAMQLLVRNTRKRLLIGIGAELLVKAVYLKSGYAINREKPASGLKVPFELTAATQARLDPNETFTLGQLTEPLKKVVQLSKADLILDGLRIAKVFRNKEGHMVTLSHKFDPSSYRAIEGALVEIYSSVFSQELTVRFSVALGEKGAWHVAP